MNDEIYFSPSDNGIKIEKYDDQRENQTGLYIEAYKSGLHDGNQQAIEVIKALQERGQLNGNPQIVINTTVNVSSDIEIAYNALDQLQDSHTSSEIEVYRKQLDELKKIIESTESKNKKWEKAGSILKWLVEQTADIAKVILPIILKGILEIK